MLVFSGKWLFLLSDKLVMLTCFCNVFREVSCLLVFWGKWLFLLSVKRVLLFVNQMSFLSLDEEIKKIKVNIKPVNASNR